MINLLTTVMFIVYFAEPTQRADDSAYDAIKEGDYYNIYKDGIKQSRTIPKWSINGKLLTVVDIVGYQRVEFTTVDLQGRESVLSEATFLDSTAPKDPNISCVNKL